MLNIFAALDLSNEIESTLGSEKYIQFTEFLASYKVGMWLYPGVIKRKFGLSSQVIYRILHSLETAGALESYYEVYCGICQKTSGIVVRTINELPETFECELCQSTLPAIENAILIYKVVSDGGR